MSEILRQQQEHLFGLHGVLLGELYRDILKLTVGVAREDRVAVANALELVREDVEALTAGLAFCVTGSPTIPERKPKDRPSFVL